MQLRQKCGLFDISNAADWTATLTPAMADNGSAEHKPLLTVSAHCTRAKQNFDCATHLGAVRGCLAGVGLLEIPEKTCFC